MAARAKLSDVNNSNADWKKGFQRKIYVNSTLYAVALINGGDYLQCSYIYKLLQTYAFVKALLHTQLWSLNNWMLYNYVYTYIT